MASARGPRWQQFLQEMVMVAGTVSQASSYSVAQTTKTICSRHRPISSFDTSYLDLISTRRAKRKRNNGASLLLFYGNSMEERNRTKNRRVEEAKGGDEQSVETLS
jgi:hypothetical protein